MTPVDLPYVPILLNETFITALWDTEAEKSFISEEAYRKYFSYRPRQKTKDRVVTAQEAPCCPLGIDFMKESKLTLDFDQKSLIIPDDQIKQLPKMEKPVEIDLSDANLDYPEAYRFVINTRKLNVITKYPRYPLPVIDDPIANIPHTGVMLTLDIKRGYFQLAISPKDIRKTAFIIHNGTFAFLRMPFGLSGVTPNFQKAIDIIINPVIGRFVMVYMDDVIITSPSFNTHRSFESGIYIVTRRRANSLQRKMSLRT
ncbi:retrovirus-related Pol polyprotein from transposon 17.6 [Trichonephila clavipes]|nr:retrovirus-related Pol polyprotein from transposon 17.6 [Trichonephila clavipes]